MQLNRKTPVSFRNSLRKAFIEKNRLEELVIQECPKLEVETLLGFIFGHNEPSIRLFTSFGFEKWAHLPEVAELDGIKRDLLILGKKI